MRDDVACAVNPGADTDVPAAPEPLIDPRDFPTCADCGARLTSIRGELVCVGCASRWES